MKQSPHQSTRNFDLQTKIRRWREGRRTEDSTPLTWYPHWNCLSWKTFEVSTKTIVSKSRNLGNHSWRRKCKPWLIIGSNVNSTYRHEHCGDENIDPSPTNILPLHYEAIRVAQYWGSNRSRGTPIYTAPKTTSAINWGSKFLIQLQVNFTILVGKWWWAKFQFSLPTISWHVLK